MVRVNIINPRKLADQHLIAEYAEILMLLGSIRKIRGKIDYSKIPKNYCLGRGHQLFFRDKLGYLKKRHEQLRGEMRKRGFIAKKSLNLSGFASKLTKDWKASREDEQKIKKRLLEKLKMKPDWYRYCGKGKNLGFWKKMLK